MIGNVIRQGIGLAAFAREGFESVLDVVDVVLRQVAGICPWVGEDFEFLVEGLGDLEGAAGGEAEAVAGFALEGGQVVEEWWGLAGRLGDLFDFAGLADAAIDNGLSVFEGPEALGFFVFVGFVLFVSFIDPAAVVATGGHPEEGDDLIVSAGDKALDLALAIGEDGEGGGLDSSYGSETEAAVAGIEGGEGAGGVDADQPV